MYRNRWPECSGMGGRNGAELVAGIKRNMHHPNDLSFKVPIITSLLQEALQNWTTNISKEYGIGD